MRMPLPSAAKGLKNRLVGMKNLDKNKTLSLGLYGKYWPLCFADVGKSAPLYHSFKIFLRLLLCKENPLFSFCKENPLF